MKQPTQEQIDAILGNIKTRAGPFTVASIKEMETYDGIAWTCAIKENGRKVGTAENDGHGGQARISGDGKAYEWGGMELEADITACALADKFPASRDFDYGGGVAGTVQLDAEAVILELMAGTQDARRLKRMAAKKTLFLMPDDFEDPAQGSFRVLNAPPTDPAAIRYFERAPDAIIFNDAVAAL